MNELHLFAGAGGVSSAQTFSDIEQYVRSRLKNIQETSYYSDSEMESSHGFQSGTTSQPLTENLGAGSWTLLPEAFLAKTFLQRERELESMASAQGYGGKWQGWSAKYDPDLSLWKTPQYSLLEDYIEFSGTWPRWGIMHDGAFWELTTSVRPIEERESGSWRIPTPTCSDAYTSNLKSTQQKPDTMHSVTLAQLCEKMPEKMWPTPTACMSKGTSENAQTRKDGRSRENDRLDHKVFALGGKSTRQTYPNPGITGLSNGSGNCEKINSLHEIGLVTEDERRSMRAGNGGQLNPDWVEWLMGWPIGWTDSKPLETDKYRQWWLQHGQY